MRSAQDPKSVIIEPSALTHQPVIRTRHLQKLFRKVKMRFLQDQTCLLTSFHFLDSFTKFRNENCVLSILTSSIFRRDKPTPIEILEQVQGPCPETPCLLLYIKAILPECTGYVCEMPSGKTG